MKKYLLIALTIVLTLTLTGCGEEESKNPSSIPSSLQGLYQGGKYTSGAEKYTRIQYYFIYSVEDNVVRRKICQSATEDCDFNDGKTGLYATKTYDIKDITLEYDEENVRFNIYDSEEIYAKCYTRFGSISCTTNEGDHLSWSKK